ncbi:hypothetical protein BC941DRAFT_108626 [Chlamydoabsidia padenii]|nr:hypothetical protein BC941DRAFT_108626 [Chlamydoabsidia padenii]
MAFILVYLVSIALQRSSNYCSIIKRSLTSSYLQRPFIHLSTATRPLVIRTISTNTIDTQDDTVDASRRKAIQDYEMFRSGTRVTPAKYSRRLWTAEEDAKLTQLYNSNGPRYTFLANQLGDRSIGAVYQRCLRLFPELKNEKYKLGPWEKDELEALRRLTKTTETINWSVVQLQLPQLRKLTHIKHTWYHSLNPQWKHGRWSQQETDRFQALVSQLGVHDWCHVSDLLGTRSPRQCLEKYRYQMSPTLKGRFTEQEDKDILLAVEKYGKNNFKAIKEAIKSPRTARQISTHYRYALDPAFDRSPWSFAEMEQVYQLMVEFGQDSVKVKEKMNSHRHIRDIWNHYCTVKRLKEKKGKTVKHAN